MKKCTFWTLNIILILLTSTIHAQIENLIIRDSVYEDTVQFTVYNPTDFDIAISYIIIQDQVLGIASGDTIINTKDSVIIKLFGVNTSESSYDIEIVEDSSNTSNMQSNGTNQNSFMQLLMPKKEQLHVYPNPGQNEITIKYLVNNNSPFTIMIFDLQGRIVNKYTDINDNQIKLNSTNILSPGGYIICISDNQGLKDCQKLIIK